SNHIVNKIRQEEREKVQLWSEAVKERLSLINYTENLFRDMRSEERTKAKIWAQATGRVLTASDNELPFLQDILSKNTTIPVLVVDSKRQIPFYRNVDERYLQTPKSRDSLITAFGNMYDPIRLSIKGIEQKMYYKDSRIIEDLEKTIDNLINSFISETVMNSGSVPVLVTDSAKKHAINCSNIDSAIVQDSLLLQRKIKEMSASNDPIEIHFGEDQTNYVFYTDSVIITQLQYFPYVQLIIIGLFLLISYLIFSTFRNAEQNQVWIGMAKETAHQLGTPLSSLMAWVQLLEARGTDKATITELNKDIERLEMITDRFSKIGSTPELKETDVKEVMIQATYYLRPRISRQVDM